MRKKMTERKKQEIFRSIIIGGISSVVIIVGMWIMFNGMLATYEHHGVEFTIGLAITIAGYMGVAYVLENSKKQKKSRREKGL